jgi:hypothetical protein
MERLKSAMDLIKARLITNYKPVEEGEGMIRVDGQDYNLIDPEDIERINDFNEPEKIDFKLELNLSQNLKEEKR